MGLLKHPPFCVGPSCVYVVSVCMCIIQQPAIVSVPISLALCSLHYDLEVCKLDVLLTMALRKYLRPMAITSSSIELPDADLESTSDYDQDTTLLPQTSLSLKVTFGVPSST